MFFSCVKESPLVLQGTFAINKQYAIQNSIGVIIKKSGKVLIGKRIGSHGAGWVQGTPEIREKDKCAEWRWEAIDNLPQPLFKPVASLLKQGYI